MTFLLTYWRYLAVAVIITAYSAFMFHLGGLFPKAKLAKLEASASAYKAESERIAKETDNDYRTKLAAVQRDWDAYRLRHPAIKTVRIVAGVCDNASGNAVVSDAVSAYLGAVGEFRSQVEGLLKECAADREQLACAVEWSGTINH